MKILSTFRNVARNIAAIGGGQMRPREERSTEHTKIETPEQRILRTTKEKFKKMERVEAKKLYQVRTKPIQRFMETGGRVITRKKGKKGRARYVVAGGISYAATKSRRTSRRIAGRPRSSFKPRVDPITGKIIRVPAGIYYRRQRLARRLSSVSYQQRQMRKARRYQRRGITPQQAAQIEAIRQQRIAQQMIEQPQEIEMRQQFPQQVSTTQFPIPQRTIIPDFFRGGTQIRLKERWLQ